MAKERRQDKVMCYTTSAMFFHRIFYLQINSVCSENDFIMNIHKSIPDQIIYDSKWTKMYLACY